MTTASLTPILQQLRTEVRSRRTARRADRALRRDLAQYTSASDLRELEAIADRHEAAVGLPTDAGLTQIRSHLAGRRAS